MILPERVFGRSSDQTIRLGPRQVVRLIDRTQRSYSEPRAASHRVGWPVIAALRS